MKIPKPLLYAVFLFVFSTSLSIAQSQCPQTLLIQFVGFDDTLCAPATRTLSFFTLNGPATGTVTSKFMDGVHSGTYYNQFSIPGGGVKPIVNYEVAGKYIAAVQVTVSNGVATCTGSATYTTQVLDQTSTYCNPVGLAERLNDAKLSLFPNPTSGIFTLGSANETKGGQLILKDITGREIYRWDTADDHVYKIPITILSGTYHLSLLTEGKEKSGKLIFIR